MLLPVAIFCLVYSRVPMPFVHVQSFTLHKGNKKEISELEDKFVKGDWSLPFSIPEPLRKSSKMQVAPPAKRRQYVAVLLPWFKCRNKSV